MSDRSFSTVNGLIEKGGEIGWTIKLSVVDCIVVGFKNTLRGKGEGGREGGRKGGREGRREGGRGREKERDTRSYHMYAGYE